MQLVSALIVWSLYKVWPLMLVFLLLTVVIVVFVKPEKRVPVVILCVFFFAISALVLSLFLRPHIVVFLSNQYGVTAQGQVVGHETLNRRHNDVRVHRYNVVYRSPEGEVVEKFFDTDDFNVYPWKNRPKYPTLNQRFTLKYLPRLPQYIIIMTDLEAEHCQELKMKLAEAERKLSFEATNTEFIKQVEDYQNQVQVHCSK